MKKKIRTIIALVAALATFSCASCNSYVPPAVIAETEPTSAATFTYEQHDTAPPTTSIDAAETTDTTAPPSETISEIISETTVTSTTTTTATTVPVPEYEYGDVNHDGAVSVADLVCCANHALGKKPSKCYEDLTDDGRIDMFDVIVLRKLLTTTITATTDGIN